MSGAEVFEPRAGSDKDRRPRGVRGRGRIGAPVLSHGRSIVHDAPEDLTKLGHSGGKSWLFLRAGVLLDPSTEAYDSPTRPQHVAERHPEQAEDRVRHPDQHERAEDEWKRASATQRPGPEYGDAEERGSEGQAPELRRVEHAEEESSGRSEEHTSELQSRQYLVCRLLLEKK